MFAKDLKAREELILILRRDNSDLQIAYNTLEKVLLEKEKALKAEDDKREAMRILRKDTSSHRKARERAETALQDKIDEMKRLRESKNREVHELSEENNVLQKELGVLRYKQKQSQNSLMEASEEKASLKKLYLDKVENLQVRLEETASKHRAT